MTKDQMLDQIGAMGIGREFIPIWEGESETVLLKPRRPARIQDGRLEGVEVDVFDRRSLRVWTPRVRQARAVAAAHGLRLRAYNGEAEVWVTADAADRLLPELGVRARRRLSEATKASLMARFSQKSPRRSHFRTPDAQKPGTGAFRG